jgi:ABC-2 type transport system permease protein
MLLTPLKSLTRVLSFFRKELVEVVRRPGAFLGLVLGPFLIMAIFGIGYSGVRRPLETVLVLPPESGLSQEVADYADLAGPAVHIREVTGDPAAAQGALARQELDMVVVAPADLEQKFRAGEQAIIRVEYNEVDPLVANYAGFLAYRLQQEVNRTIIERAVGEGQEYAVTRLGEPGAAAIPAQVVAAPTRAETVNVAQTPPAVVPYFTPAVLALVLQHMAVTLTALSLVRDRLSGAMELFRVSPVGVVEILLGKYLSFGLLTAAMGAGITALAVLLLNVPLLSPPSFMVLVGGLLILASLGLGLFISAIADSERQAVQLSLLVLLASVFFSGLVLPIHEFHPIVATAAHALPVTSGIRLFQDAMLRGGTYAGHLLAVLAAISAAFFILTALILRTRMTRA